MAKKQSPIRKRSDQKDQIDNIAKYCVQPRSLGPKRPRTDFANLIGFSPSSTYGGSWPGSSSDKDELSNVTMTSVEGSKYKAIQLHDLPLVLCGKSESKEFGVSSSSIDVSPVEAEPVSQDSISDLHSDRNVMEQKSDVAATLELTPMRSQVAESCSVSVAPGSIVWAKTACQMWWPAEIMDEGSTLAESGNQGRIDGHVLVQFYGNLQRAWVDPARDISQLEECFEKRSCNSSENFQDALKQALQGKEHLSSRIKLLEDQEGCGQSNQQDHASAGQTSSISSSEVLESWRKKRAQKSKATSSVSSKPVPQTRRGQRERKPKLHFDEPKRPSRSKSEPRRIRIMRYLGLAPPAGSPF